MVDVLALGSRTHPVTPRTYLARSRVFGSYPLANGDPILVTWRGSLFNYFFASCWLNFSSRGFDLHPIKPVDIWRNNQFAIEANHQFCIDHSSQLHGEANGFYTTYGENAWGLTACDNLVASDAMSPSEYFSFGALPSEENLRFNTRALHSGTLAVYGAASSINFLPKQSIQALRHYFEIPRLWNPLFGFGDAFSLDPHYLESPYDHEGNPTVRQATYLNGPWVNPMTMGVNVGPMLLAIENYRTGFVWNLMAKAPEISAGLDRIFGIGVMDPRLVAVEHHSPAVVRIRWEAEAGASEYSIFGSTDLNRWQLIETGVKGTEWIDRHLPQHEQRFYLVKAVR
ncbi:MAG TPA: glucoamylase family protein, partial [Candidatus Paceibacterota bacterium]|nr:glucoamylase family protein [Candidatus Paceibacterota bacterium]